MTKTQQPDNHGNICMECNAIEKIRSQLSKRQAWTGAAASILSVIFGVSVGIVAFDAFMNGRVPSLSLLIILLITIYLSLAMSMTKCFWAVPGVQQSLGRMEASQRDLNQLADLKMYSAKTETLYLTAVKSMGGRVRLGYFTRLTNDLLDIIETEQWASKVKAEK